MHKNKILEQNILQTWGSKGKYWLDSLPEIINRLSQYWNIEKLIPMKNLTFNYVALGFQNSKAVVLKIGCDKKNIKNEYLALKAYDSKGSIRLLDAHLDYNALLIECAIPGTSLKSFYPKKDDLAVEIASNIIKSLHSTPINTNLDSPLLENQFQDLYEFEHHREFSLYKALEIAEFLFNNNTEKVLLHADLHHDNILQSERGYISIDPHGIIGYPGYEVCAFIRNPNPEILKPKKVILHRLELFSQALSIDKYILHQWIYLNAVLNGIWKIKDGEKNFDIAFAEAKLCEPN